LQGLRISDAARNIYKDYPELLDENNNDDSSSNMNGQPTILPAKTDSNSEDSDSESGDEIKDPFEYYRLKFHLYDIE
jgi:hypothetical protein